MERNQFTWYRSYYEAMKTLPAEDFKATVLAICDYALNETLPQLDGVPNAIFTLVRPTLDSGRNKAANRRNKPGQTRNTPEQTDNKPEQTRKEKEEEREEEEEKEGENDSSIPPVVPPSGATPPKRFTPPTPSQRFSPTWLNAILP